MNAPRPTRSRASGAIASASAVAVCVGLCLGALAFLIPNRDQLFERFITDGDADSAAKLVASPADTDDTAVITALTDQTLQLCHDNNWSRESVQVLDNFLRNTGDLEPIAAEILRQADSIPAAPRVLILGTLIKRSLAQGARARAETLQLRLLDAADTLAKLEKKNPANKPFPCATSHAMQLVDLRRYTSAGQTLLKARKARSSSLTPEDIASHRDSLRFVRQFTRLGVDAGHHRLDIPNPSDDRYFRGFLTGRHQFSRSLHASAALGSVAGEFAWRTSLAWTRPTQDSRFEITLASHARAGLDFTV